MCEHQILLFELNRAAKYKIFKILSIIKLKPYFFQAFASRVHFFLLALLAILIKVIIIISLFNHIWSILTQTNILYKIIKLCDDRKEEIRI